MYKTGFEIEGINRFFEGYTNGIHWNGWACPWFTKEVSEEIMALYNTDYGKIMPMRYDSDIDSFVIGLTGETYQGVDFTIKGKTVHLYPIRNGCWIWEDVADYQGVCEKTVYNYLLEEYSEHLPSFLYEMYHGIIQEINGSMSDQETKAFVEGYISAFYRYAKSKTEANKQ